MRLGSAGPLARRSFTSMLISSPMCRRPSTSSSSVQVSSERSTSMVMMKSPSMTFCSMSSMLMSHEARYVETRATTPF
jgi:hypothetical protein